MNLQHRDAASPWLALVLLLLGSPGCGDHIGVAIGPATDGGGPDGLKGPDAAINAVASNSGGMGCAAGNRAVYLLEPGAKTWSALQLSPQDQSKLQGLRLFGVACPSNNTIVAVGSQDVSPPSARVAVFTRSGGTWQLGLHTPASKGDLFAITAVKEKELMAVGYRASAGPATSLAIKTTDPVLGSWREDTRLMSWPPLHGLWVPPDSRRVAVGAAGTLLYSPGNVQPYHLEKNPRGGAVTMRAVWAPNNGSFVAAGDGGALLRRDKAGLWKDMPDKGSKSTNWRAIHGSAEDNIFAVGGQTIAHYDGLGWHKVASIKGLPTVLDLRAVWVDAASNPPRLHLAGDKLLATCTITAGTPPALACKP